MVLPGWDKIIALYSKLKPHRLFIFAELNQNWLRKQDHKKACPLRAGYPAISANRQADYERIVRARLGS